MDHDSPARPAAGDAGIVASIDLGKTSCRLRIVPAGPGAGSFEHVGAGSPGLAEHGGADAAAEAILGVLADASRLGSPSPTHLVIGAAGCEASPDQARRLAERLRTRTGTATVIASDLTMAHAGALRGEPGAVLIAGTGAAALALDADGGFRQVDGWGPWLGDEGSGRWIGQEGVRAALRAEDGRGPGTSLRAAMRAIVGAPSRTPAWVSASGNPARTLGTIAQVVLDHAAEGDGVAASIVDTAVERLAETARAVAVGGAPICLIGGLLDRAELRAALETRIEAFAPVRPPLGNPLDGARLIATADSLPYEKKVIRA